MERTPEPRPNRITTDTQLLAYSTSRRFLMALWELAGATLTITPTVAEELADTVRHAETRRWQKIINRDYSLRNYRYSEAVFRNILKQTSRAASDWIQEELETPGTAIANAPAPSEAVLEADKLSERFPAHCFLRTHGDNHLNDRLIVAQAVTLGYQLIATGNIDSIDHYSTNAWLQENGYTKSPLIVQLADTLPELCNRQNPGDACLAAALGASLPQQDQGPRRDIELLNTFLQTLEKTHATTCARLARLALRQTSDIEHLVRTTRNALPDRTRATEQRRLDTTFTAARQAGYHRS